MQLQTGEVLSCVGLATVPALVLWGLVSARMQVKPWLMMVLAVVVMAGSSIFQLMVAAQPLGPAPFHDVVEKLKLFQMAWAAVALAMGGALMGAAVAAQAAQLHANEVRRIDAATTSSAASVNRIQKEIAALRACAQPATETEKQLANAQRRLIFCIDEFLSVQRNRERLGLPEHLQPW